MRPVPRHRAEHAERRRDGVAPAFDGELDDACRDRSTRDWARTTRPPSARCPGRPGGSTCSRCRRAGRAGRAQRCCGAPGWSGRSPPRCGRRNPARAGAASTWGPSRTHARAATRRHRRAAVRRSALREALRLPWASPDICRRSDWMPLSNLPGRQLPGQRPPSSTVSADGTPPYPWRTPARRERRDLREQERVPAGDGGGAAHRPGGRAGQRPRYRGHLDDGLDARARRRQGRAPRPAHLAPARRRAADHRGRPRPEPADARLLPAARRAGGARGRGEHRQAGRR